MIDVIIVGAGAAGLFCARTAARRGLSVLVLEAQKNAGRKVAICGGGYGNFTNSDVRPQFYYSRNPHFMVSGLKRYPTDLLVRTLEQDGFDYEMRGDCYFCTEQIHLWMETVREEAESLGVQFLFNTRVTQIRSENGGFSVNDNFFAKQVVLACGGRAYPQVGGTFDGLKLAKALGMNITDTMPGLAPIRFPAVLRKSFSELQGIALEEIKISVAGKSFLGSLVFRPDGIGGIAVFKAASEWAWKGGDIEIDFAPSVNIEEKLKESRQHHGTVLVRNCIAQFLPRRLGATLVQQYDWSEKTISQLKKEEMQTLIATLKHFKFTPMGIGDFSEAEVMMGGVDTDELSSKTFMSKNIPNLYIAGEMMDVTGQLGGYNLHWAFATGSLIGQILSAQEQ